MTQNIAEFCAVVSFAVCGDKRYLILCILKNKIKSVLFFYEQVERYLRKLDQEVSRFKMELEADHAGITEVLERSK